MAIRQVYMVSSWERDDWVCAGEFDDLLAAEAFAKLLTLGNRCATQIMEEDAADSAAEAKEYGLKSRHIATYDFRGELMSAEDIADLENTDEYDPDEERRVKEEADAEMRFDISREAQ